MAEPMSPETLMAALKTARLEHLFTTPIMRFLWPDSDALNADLKRLILEQEAATSGRRISNIGGWQSKEDMQHWAGAAGQALIRRVHAMLLHATGELLSDVEPKPRLQWNLTFWANVNRRGQMNRMHFHPGSTWSAVYYVEAGDPPPEDNPSAGALGLMNPNQAAPMSFFCGQLKREISIQPETGLMVFFPSYLPHTVYPYLGDTPRISVAFNIQKQPYP